MAENKPNEISEKKKSLLADTGEIDLLSYRQRIDICNKCENYVKITKQCNICFCFMPIKARMKGMSCPINKW